MKRFNFKLALFLICAVVSAIIIFETMKELGFYLGGIIIYSLITLVAAIYYVCYNRGIISKIKKEELPSVWKEQEKDTFLAEQEERKRKSKWVLLILLPMIATFAYEIIEIYFLRNFIR